MSFVISEKEKISVLTIQPCIKSFCNVSFISFTYQKKGYFNFDLHLTQSKGGAITLD